MATLNISRPKALKAFVDAQVAEDGYGSSSAYIRELIRKDQDRQGIRALLLDGAAAPPSGPADEVCFDSLRARLPLRRRRGRSRRG